MRFQFFPALILIIPAVSSLSGAELNLRGIGKISGTIISETRDTLVLSNALWPSLSIPREHIVPDDAARVPGTVSWRRSLMLGTAVFSGNSSLTTLSAGVRINRNSLWINEWDFSFTWDQAWEKDDISLRQIRSSLRYGHSFSQSLYGYLSSDITHDMNSSLDYRLIPLAGAGCWLVDSRQIAIMLEAGGGWRRDASLTGQMQDNAVLLLRSFVRASLSQAARLEASLRWLPALSQPARYLIEQTGLLSLHIMHGLGLTLEYRLTVNSPAAENAKATDHSLKTALEWTF